MSSKMIEAYDCEPLGNVAKLVGVAARNARAAAFPIAKRVSGRWHARAFLESQRD